MERNLHSKTTAAPQNSEKEIAESSLSEVLRKLPRSNLSLSKADVAEMAKNIAGRSAASTSADKKAR